MNTGIITFLNSPLQKKLLQNKRAGISSIIYAQCPLSAKAALETRLPGQKVLEIEEESPP